jgi:hypothetical protein
VEEEKPKFTHDCDRCAFLGHYHNHDLYACARNGKIDTVIARYGDKGPEYASGLLFAIHGTTPELVEAFLRARAKGLRAGSDAVGVGDQALHLYIDKIRGQMAFVGSPRPTLPAFVEAMTLAGKQIEEAVKPLTGQLMTPGRTAFVISVAEHAIRHAKNVTGLEIQLFHHMLNPTEYDLLVESVKSVPSSPI